jgi:putative Mg2+ transporter-C (MgtC) family protein
VFSGTFETETAALELTIRLSLAVFFGGLIGIERELKARPAGLRTNMMVSLAAAAFTLLGAELIAEGAEARQLVQVDPLRIIEAVIAGVAFLGAGAIIRAGQDVKGLTTGASLWISGSVGVACGGGYYLIAVIVTALALLVLSVLVLVEGRDNAPKPK